jgi:hypothetical protein
MRYLLIFLAACAANLTAADAVAPAKAKTNLCTGAGPLSQWSIDSAGNFHDYPGIQPGITTMTLGPHPSGNAGEWQIKFSSPNSSTAPNPPAVDIMHLVAVPGTSNLGETLPHPSLPFLEIAYSDIMRGKHPYMAAVGYVDSVPTLAVLALSKPNATDNCRRFNLILVKLAEVQLHGKSIRQGGVIHGKEN